MFESSAEIPSQSLAQLLTKLSTKLLFFSAAVLESLLWCFLKKISYYLNCQNASFSNTVPLIQRLEPELNLQENTKTQQKSYLLRWINNYRVLLLVYLDYRYIYTFLVYWPSILMVKQTPKRSPSNPHIDLKWTPSPTMDPSKTHCK